MTKADDAVKRVEEFFAGFIPNEKIFNYGPLPGDRSSLNVEDIRTILAELEDQAAEVDRLKRDEILYDELADKQAAEIERLRGALERLASPEAFTVSQVLPRGGLGDECRERMLFAEQALKGEA